MAKKKWRAPIRVDGSLMPYPRPTYNLNERDENGHAKCIPPETVPPDTQWKLDLVFDDFDKGAQSAYRFIATDDQGRKWPMSIKQFQNMMEKVVIDHGEVSGTFGVIKQGQNYSLTYEGPYG
jgi:hypothetical protein